METPVKFCKDCKHCVPAKHWRINWWMVLIPIFGWFDIALKFSSRNLIYKFSKCKIKPQNTKHYDFVNGDLIPAEYWFCSTQRGSDNLCGPFAKFFEAK